MSVTWKGRNLRGQSLLASGEKSDEIRLTICSKQKVNAFLYFIDHSEHEEALRERNINRVRYRPACSCPK